MFKVTEDGIVWKVQVRAHYSRSIRSEKALRQAVKDSIAAYEARGQVKYAAALRQKGLWEICSLFGIITNKWRV